MDKEIDFSRIDSYIDESLPKMKEMLGALVAIPSKEGKPSEGKPFGEECAKVLAKMTEYAEAEGLHVINHENYLIECNLSGGETPLGAIAHLDVVPECDGWETEPYKLVERDGALYGRGSIDDKGPAVAVFWGLKALIDCGAKPSKNVRLLFGANEETGMRDLEYYRKKCALPPMMLTPDGSYPVINVEKGVCQVNFKKEFSAAGNIKSISAGTVVNAVPDKAKALISGVTAQQVAEAVPDEVTVKMDILPTDGGAEIEATGLCAHGSTPQKGDNALTALLWTIKNSLGEDTELLKTLSGLLSLFPYGEVNGESAGLKMSDAESGDLTALLSILNFDGKTLSGGIDIRFPATVKLEDVYKIISEKLQGLGFEVTSEHCMEGHLVSSDSDFVKTLLKSYTEVTGKVGECIAEAGATYLHEVDGGVAFGAEMPGEENNMHGANEHINIETFLNTAKIYARAIYALCN